PLPSHPGHIFLAGESVVIPAPSEFKTWQAADYEGKTVAKGTTANGQAQLGKLPVGYYELADGAQLTSNHISLAVLEPLHVRTPPDSPIGIDVALAWSSPVEKMADAVSLCALAGMNRVRDRLLWAEIEPERGKFAADTRYDAALKAQAAAGLKVLQVNHTSPA